MHANTKEIDLTSCNMDDNILNIIKECKYLSKLNLMRFGTHEMTSEGLFQYIDEDNLFLNTLYRPCRLIFSYISD